MTSQNLESGALPDALASTNDTKAEANQASLSLLAEIGTAASNQCKTVYNAVAQVADALGSDLPQAQLQSLAPTQTFSARWFAQQGGSLAVTLPLLLLTGKCVTAISEPFEASALEAAGAQSWTVQSSQRLALSRLTATGALYEGLFKPSDDQSPVVGRLKQACEGGLGFLAMGLTASRLSGMVIGSAAESAVSPSLTRRVFATALSGIGGGAGYGLVSSQSKSIFDTGRLDLSKGVDAAGSGALMGLTLSSIGLIGRAEQTQSENLAQPNTKFYTGMQAFDRDVVQTGTQEGGQDSGQNLGGDALSKPEDYNKAMSTSGSDDVLAGLDRDRSLSAPAASQAIDKAQLDLRAANRLSGSGQHQDALQRFNDATSSLVRVHGTEHPAVAEALASMARSDMFVGNTSRSLTSLQSAVRINQNTLGQNSPHVADNYEQMSAIYQRAGDYGQAAKSLDLSLTSRQGASAEGKLSPGEALEFQQSLPETMGRLASLYAKSGDQVKSDQVRASIPQAPVQLPELRHLQ